MKNYEPVMSFGEDAAERHDDVKRGDEVEAVAFLEQMVRGGPALELAVGTPGGSRFRWPPEVSMSMASTSRLLWSTSYVPSLEAINCRSRLVTSQMCLFRAPIV